MQKNELMLAIASTNVLVKDLKSYDSLADLFNHFNSQNIKLNTTRLDNDLKYIEKNDITLISYFDDDYPQSLKIIDYPPIVLFVKGKFDSSKLFFSIVGTRYPSGYGEKCAQMFSKELTLSGFSIVSGFARGIDKIVHRFCIDNGGYSIGVFDCGIDVIYPEENEELFYKMSQNGALISEFGLSTPPNAYNFPRRNRIITGLSEGLLVVEADIKSGSLISAKYAQEQSKPVFSIPGEIFSKRSRGTNQLIKEGAFVATDPSDMIFYFYSEIKSVLKSSSFMDNVIFKEDPVRSLTKNEVEILNIIEGEMSLDEIAEKTSLSIDEIVSVIFDLEVKNLIKRLNFDKVSKV